MSYSNSPSRISSNEEYLQQRISKINLTTETQNEMYINNEDMQTSSGAYANQADVLSSSWDYTTPPARNLDAVITELTPEEVRWFYKSEGEKRWLEFSGYDSYRIEVKFREIFDPAMKYSQTSAFSGLSTYGPNYSRFPVREQAHGSSATHSYQGSSSGYFGSSSIKFPSKQTSQISQGRTNWPGDSQQLQRNIIVRGGLYDVNFETWKCASIYWPGEECFITRGTWFYEGTWQPLEREYSTVLETKHLSMFQGHQLSEYAENEAKGTVIHTETFADFIVEWFSPNQIYLYSENKPSKIVRTVTTRLGFHKSTGYRLFRGYKNEASLNDRPDVEITHLVFVIHGIGQKMDTGRIIRNTSRDCVSWLKQKYFSNFPNHRAEFFPVEWRSNLQLDGELVDAITPNTLQTLRQMLNASAMDIMYYTSPLYGEEVQRGLREELNRLYSMFSARNPYFINKGGKVSVIAHSLGCVILYDIIMGLRPGSMMQSSQQGLLFQVQNFFCLGSPLSVFLALRWKDSQIPGRIDIILPRRLCHRLYNVFHPTDPVAYRIEPLLVKEFSKVAPLVIQPYNASYHTPYSEMPLEILVPEQQDAGQEIAAGSHIGGKREEFNATLSSGKDISNNSNKWNFWGLWKGDSKKSGDDGFSLDTKGAELEYRLDYILRESNLGVSYLSALTSHTAYWTNYDVAYFVLTQVFPEFEKSDMRTDRNFADKCNSYSQNFPLSSQRPADNRIFPYDDPDQISNRLPLSQQQQIDHTFTQPRSVSNLPQIQMQKPIYSDRPQGAPDYSQVQPNYPHSGGPPQNFPPHMTDQQNYPQQFQMGLHPNYSSYSAPASQNYQQAPNQNFQQMQNVYPEYTQNFHQQPTNYQTSQNPMHQQDFPLQQQQQQQQFQQQQSQNFQQPQNYQHQQQQSQNFQQASQNAQGQIISGFTKNIQTKTGFFDKITEEKKPQSATSPVKSTKSFFPTFNLSSLTSPVKNLSNSLSNISNQMSNMTSNKDSALSGSGNIQSRPTSTFLGSSSQSRNVPPNYTQPNRPHSPQVQLSHGQVLQGQYQQISPSRNQFLNQNQQPQTIIPSSSYDKQITAMGIRSNSPVSMQSRCSPMHYGPIETPIGAIKPKTIRIQPKIPSFDQKVQFGHDPTNLSNKSRCVSPLGQSKVICSGGRSVLNTGSYNIALGARSLSSGNLRNSTLISGTYPGSRSTLNYYNQATYLSPSGLNRRTMSRPNLSTSGSSLTSSGLGISSLVYNSSYPGSRSYLNRDYSGPSSR